MAGESDQVPAPVGLVGSVRRALQVLEVVAQAGDGVTAKAVARRTGFKLPTTYHLLNTLVHEGYLVRLHHARGYGLGYKLTGLHRQLCEQLDVTPRVAGALEYTHRRSGTATYYGVFRDAELVVAHVVDSAAAPRVQPLDVGFHEAAHATAFGKVLLAAMTPAQRRDYLFGAGLARLTDRTITRLDTFEEELAQVREVGLAQEVEEFRPDLACVAAPVINEDGAVVGAVATSAPAAHFAAHRGQMAEAVRGGAARASRLLAAPA
jgi:DNA-binding IclR family transcriptional regulator